MQCDLVAQALTDLGDSAVIEDARLMAQQVSDGDPASVCGIVGKEQGDLVLEREFPGFEQLQDGDCCELLGL